MAQINPSDEEIQSRVSEIRITSPTIGLQKLLTAIKSQEPSWSLSEKVPSPQPLNSSLFTVISSD